MYVCTYVHMYTRMHTCMYARMHVCAYARTRVLVHTYVCAYVRTCIYVCKVIRVDVCISTNEGGGHMTLVTPASGYQILQIITCERILGL